MTLQVLPFEMTDLLRLEPYQNYERTWVLIWRYILRASPRMLGAWSWTGWNACGLPVACCGIIEIPGIKPLAWVFVDRRAGPGSALAMTRRVLLVLDLYIRCNGPVYMEVDKRHREAVRWAALLGFKEQADDPQLWIKHL